MTLKLIYILIKVALGFGDKNKGKQQRRTSYGINKQRDKSS